MSGEDIPCQTAPGCSPSPSFFPWTTSVEHIELLSNYIVSHRICFVVCCPIQSFNRDQFSPTLQCNADASELQSQRVLHTFFFPLLLFAAAKALASLVCCTLGAYNKILSGNVWFMHDESPRLTKTMYFCLSGFWTVCPRIGGP